MRIDEQNRILIAYKEMVPGVFTADSFSQARHRGRIQTTVPRGGRGREVEIIYNTLPESYKRKICAALGDPAVMLGLTPVAKGRVSISEFTPKELQLCTARYNLVVCLREFAETNKAKGITRAKRDFVELVNSGSICADSASVVGKVSFQTLARWDKALRDGGDVMDALAPERREKRGTALSDAQKQRLIELYLMPNKYTVSTCYRFACKIWNSEGVNAPSEATCRRFLDEWAKNNTAISLFRREGLKALKDKQLPYIERNPDSIQFMDVLVADGRRMDFQIAHPVTGNPCRPTLIAWQDMRTGLVLGFELMITENTMSVASAFRQACINAGKFFNYNGAIMPRSVYMDNGRAFKNKFFNESVDLQSSIGGLFERLKMNGLEHVQYAKPYNASSKVIERSFESFGELDKLVPTYVGNGITNKPAHMMRNEIYHRDEFAKAISKSGWPTLWGAYRFIEWWLTGYNARVGKGRYLDGKSPVELAASQIADIDFSGRLLQGNSLDYMMMNTKVMKRKRNGFRLNGIWYYNLLFTNTSMENVDYIVKYDVLDPMRILVYHEDGTFWCEATPWIGQGVHAMAALGSDADRKKRNEALRTQRAIEKSVVNAGKNLNKDINALLMNATNAPLLSEGEPLLLPEPQEELLTNIKLF